MMFIIVCYNNYISLYYMKNILKKTFAGYGFINF